MYQRPKRGGYPRRGSFFLCRGGADHTIEIINNILSIFCHILHDESEIEKNLQDEQQQQLNEELIQSSITNMSVSCEHAIESLLKTNHNLELLVDYCFTHPHTDTTKITNNQTLIDNLNQQKSLVIIKSLSKESVDQCTNNIILKILDILPNIVYKICELIVITIHRNDTNHLNQYNEQLILNFLNDHKNSILFSRTLLISLLFKEIPFPCARITEKFSLIHYFSILIHRVQRII
ncbi:unnamed protein product [Rotaria sp. Silwood1]|nr:unnamed protein product [Rotaria sp. Silwood1]